MTQEQDFKDMVAVVTGAGGGVGAMICSLLQQRGARVFGIDVQWTERPSIITCIDADVSDVNSMTTAMSEVLSKTEGVVDAMFNNAGIASVTDVLACSPEEWDKVFSVNVKGVFLGTRLVLPSMLKRGRGVIINTASAAGMIGLPDRAAYCASKGAVISLTKQVAVQYARQGVRCNAVAPGTVDSPWVARLLAMADNPDEARRALIDRQPLGRLATPTEIAQAAIYLASPAAAFATGTILVIDGGILAA